MVNVVGKSASQYDPTNATNLWHAINSTSPFPMLSVKTTSRKSSGSQSLSVGTVPVVVGSRKKSYQTVAPPNSFIHFSDYKSIDDLVDYLNRLDKDDEAYRRLQDWRSQGEGVLNWPTRPTIFCRALPHLHAGETRCEAIQVSWRFTLVQRL